MNMKLIFHFFVNLTTSHQNSFYFDVSLAFIMLLLSRAPHNGSPKKFP